MDSNLRPSSLCLCILSYYQNRMIIIYIILVLFTHFMATFSSLNVGLSSGSYCQHEFISRKREAGHSGGRAKRSPFSIRLMTSSFLMPTKGLTPLIKISQQHTPNIQTSLRPVNRRKLMLSGAIHLMGSLPREAAKKGAGEGREGKEGRRVVRHSHDTICPHYEIMFCIVNT